MSQEKEYEKKDHVIRLLKRLMPTGESSQYHLLVERYHEADIAEALDEMSFEERWIFFSKVNLDSAHKVFEDLDLYNQIELVLDFDTNLAASYVEEMEPDDAADLFEELFETDEEIADKIIKALPKKEAADIKKLLAYQPDSAGSIMTSEFVSIPENLSVEQALRYFKRQCPPESEVAFYIYVIDVKHKLVGYTTLRDLVMSEPNAKVNEIRKENPVVADINMDQEDVAKLFEKYDLVVLPVITKEEKLVGIITVDDVVDVVIEEATEDIYRLAGTGDAEESKLISGNILYSVMSRLPWLVMTIFGGIIASFLITRYSGLYQSNLFTLALSLSFVPMLMGLGGNVGNQSATIIVRGLSTGVVKEDHPFKYIFRELAVGLFIGAIIALLVFMFSYIMRLPLIFSGIVAVSLVINITVAAFIGTVLPLVFQRLNIDPAVASAPFISSALDIIGQIIYFTLTLTIIGLMGS